MINRAVNRTSRNTTYVFRTFPGSHRFRIFEYQTVKFNPNRRGRINGNCHYSYEKEINGLSHRVIVFNLKALQQRYPHRPLLPNKMADKH